MFSLQNQEHYRSGSLKNLILDTNMCYLLPTLAWQGAINGLLALADKEKKNYKGTTIFIYSGAQNENLKPQFPT